MFVYEKKLQYPVKIANPNPKLAAALYASQGDKTPVLEIGSPMDIGDYPAGNIGDIWAFTNAEEVALYKNDRFVASFRTKG